MKKTYISYAGYGVDVACHRADDLDTLCLEHIAAKRSARVLDLGSGAGGQSLRMVEAGAEVIAVDVYDFANAFTTLRTENRIDATQLQFVQGNIKTIFPQLTFGKVTDVIIQRTIHYLPYQEALELLSRLCQMVEDKLFISVTGLGSAVSAEYAGKTVAIKDRFFVLTPEQSRVFSISQPMCLYGKEEFITLLEKSGWKVERCWESDFGNIKAICSH